MVILNPLEHSKRYLVNIRIFETDYELNYLCSRFSLNSSGGALAVHQKGRKIAAAFKGQPTMRSNLRLYMTEEDFTVVISYLAMHNRPIFIIVYRLNVDERFSLTSTKKKIVTEMVGFIDSAQIVAEVGQFVTVDLTILVDDIAEIDPNNLPEVDL